MKTEEKLAILGVLNVVDWLLTLHAVSIGATELNPLIAEFVDEPLKFTAIKLGVGSGAVLAASVMAPRIEPGTTKQIAEFLINVLLVAYAAITVSNVVQLIYYYMTH